MFLYILDKELTLRKREPGHVSDGAVSLQLIAVVEEQDEQRAESGISGSCDIMTATSSLSDEVSGQLTAEARREMWRRGHGRPRSSDVHQHEP